jgi:hypothetical protein
MSFFGRKKEFSAADALLDPHRFQVTTVSLARFENIFFNYEKRHSFLESFETGWGLGAHQLLKTGLFLPKNGIIRLLDILGIFMFLPSP